MSLVFETGAGNWAPVVLVAAAAIVLVIVFLIRSRGNSKARKLSDQSQPFFSGNLAPEENIASSNLYWGFFESMKGYYGIAKRLHSGIVNDFVFWLILLALVLLVSIALEGLKWA